MDTQENSEQNGQAFDGAEVFGEIANQFAQFTAQTHEAQITKVLQAEGIELPDNETRADALRNQGYMIIRRVDENGVHTIELLKIVQTRRYKIDIKLDLESNDSFNDVIDAPVEDEKLEPGDF